MVSKNGKRVGRPISCFCGACPKCKRREYMRRWRETLTDGERRAIVARRDPEAVRRNDRARYYRQREQRLAEHRAYLQTEAGREATRRKTQHYREAHPERYAAHNALNNALRDGRIKRGRCAACGTSEDVHGHHEDYARPLDVTWLCASCHRLYHAGVAAEAVA